ncbi:MAG TPA: hypothetical protein EYP85_14810 [Armatimonadetes bacterium]|nr:hypothetical protein [Armatimonadota bacterium]
METRIWILDYYRLEVETGMIWRVTQEIELPADYHEHEESGIFRVGEQVVLFNRLHYGPQYTELFRVPTQYLTLASRDYPFRAYPADENLPFNEQKFTVRE